MSLTDKAKEYLNSGLSIVLTKEDKRPALFWDDLEKKPLTPGEIDSLLDYKTIRPEIEHELTNKKTGEKFIIKGLSLYPKAPPVGIGIITGAISGGLEVIDVDTKYDTTGRLWDEFRTLIEDNLPEVYSSLVIAQTKSGGYHIYYRCKEIKGNLKLATKQNREVLIETRGEGGYVIAPPTEKYKYIQGGPFKLPTITPEQRAVLFSIAKSFNELPEEEPKVYTPSANSHSSTGLTPWEDYDNRGDVVGLLGAKGWKVVSRSGDRIKLLRPGDTTSKDSGNFHTRLRLFYVWSTSTEFTPEHGYTPSKVFSILECNGDSSLGAKRLIELGYGDKPNGGYRGPTQIKTELITVNLINKVNRESSVISSPGESLKIENIQTAIGEEIVISSPGEEASEEVLKAIELIQETGKRIYIKQGEELEVRSYQYQLQAILSKFSAIQEQGAGLTQRELDNLLDEIIGVANKIKEPIDRDQYKKEFTSLEFIKELGITEESLSITLERLTSTQAKEDQAKEFKKLLSEATALQDKGEIDKALELLDKQSKQIKATTGKGLLPPPMSFTTLLQEIATTPPSYKTGYSSLDKFVGFTPGAISLIAGRPSHGKTTLLFNLLLEMSRLYKDESFYFFTYEEPVKNLSVKLLNRLIATDLSGHYRELNLSKPTNYEFLKAYVKAQRTDLKEIEDGKRIFKELIDSQRIKIIDKNYSVEELYNLIAYVNKKEKIGGVFIDYIQRMRTERRTQDKRTEIAHISDQVLQIAKDSGLPIILGAQLNRATLKKPTLENLKEAGNLEEDANTVLSVYNESREQEENENGDSYNGLREVELEIKALKNREGEVNKTAKLTFDKWTGVIKNQDKSSQYF